MSEHETDAPGGMEGIDDQPVRTPAEKEGPGGMSAIPPEDTEPSEGSEQ